MIIFCEICNKFVVWGTLRNSLIDLTYIFLTYNRNSLMKKSALQQARAAYQPKLPIVLTGAKSEAKRS